MENNMEQEDMQKSAKPDPEEIKDLLEEDEDLSPVPPVETANQKPVESSPSQQTQERGLEFLYDVPLQISVEVGRSKILLKDLLMMGEGYIVELDKLAGDPLDLYVNSKLIARGEAVMVGDKFGIRLTDVVSPSDRVEQLG